MPRFFLGAPDLPPGPVDTRGLLGPAPLPKGRALVAAAWIGAVGLAFVFGIAKRLLWHLFR